MGTALHRRTNFRDENAFALPKFDDVKSPIIGGQELKEGPFNIDLNLNLDLDKPDLPQHSPKAAATYNVSLFNIGRLPQLELPPLQDLNSEPATEACTSSITALLDPEPDPDQFQTLTDLEVPQEDVWQLPQTARLLVNETRLLSWENSAPGRTSNDLPPRFLTEAGPPAFDASLIVRARSSKVGLDAGRVIAQDVLLRSLLQAGLGRDSVLFPYDPEATSFTQAIGGLRGSGLSVESSESFIEGALRLGRSTRELTEHVQFISSAPDTLATKVALATAISTGLTGFEEHLTTNIRSIRSLLQLQAVFEPAQQIIRIFKELVKITKRCDSDEDVLEAVFTYVQSQQHLDVKLLCVIQQTFSHVAKPWLDKLEAQLGLTQDHTIDQQHPIAVEDKSVFDIIQRIPKLIPASDRDLIAETKECLEFVREHRPSHILVNRHHIINVHKPRLSIAFTWTELGAIKQRAEAYRLSIQASTDRLHEDGEVITDPSTLDENWTCPSSPRIPCDNAIVESSLLPDIDAFSVLPNICQNASQNTLRSALLAFLSPIPDDPSCNNPPSPPLPSIPHLSLYPLISIQNSLLTSITLSTLLPPLQDHLRLHNTFSLFSSGHLTTLLTSALFNTDLQSAERSKSHLRTGGFVAMGLKLGSSQRANWPPASSEVQLALRDVVSEVWRRESYTCDLSPKQLSGYVAFAIRTDVSPDTVDRILDADSLCALDFLRLAYEPPAVLRCFFTEKALEKYDRIFAFWLRMLRVRNALEQLWHLTRPIGAFSGKMREWMLIRRMRVEATTFFDIALSYLRGVGLEGPWREFSNEVEALATKAEARERDTLTLANLLRLHHHTLKQLLHNHLLRRGQRSTLQAFESIGQSVLDLVAHLQSLLTSPSNDEERRVQDIVEAFASRKIAFLSALAKQDRDGERDTMGDLLQLLKEDG